LVSTPNEWKVTYDNRKTVDSAQAVIFNFRCIAIFFRLMKYKEKSSKMVVPPFKKAFIFGKNETHDGITSCFGRRERKSTSKNTTTEIM